tara:strand:- start:4975 stop:5436 length:462 start_codon:yes stop_codon:yes gene_type:complete
MGYATSLKRNSSIASLKMIDQDSLKVSIYFRGCNKTNTFFLCDLVFDTTIISSLPPKSAATIGYYYGINYKKMLPKKGGFSFSLQNEKENIKNQIISIDRSKNIVFSSQLNKLERESVKMHPFDIMSNTSLLSNFHPLQACYIGIQAGIKRNR